MARPRHEPTRQTIGLVQLHATIGTPQETIARLLNIDAKTLRKHYRDELDLAHAQAVASVASFLFQAASGKALGNGADGKQAATVRDCLTAGMFWLKTQGGWRETSRHEVTGEDGGAIKVDAEQAAIATLTAELARLAARATAGSDSGKDDGRPEGGAGV